ncbi:ATP-binding protein [Pedobacter paludis]|nr:ATP-binding protein [Pedobacter paludis]
MKTGLLGYTYQNEVAALIIGVMDVEREIEQITIEADVEHKFDDIWIQKGKQNYFLQIKDINNISLSDLQISGNSIKIAGKPHRLSAEVNIIFFKALEFEPNTTILGFEAYLLDGVFLIAMDRRTIGSRMERLFQSDFHRLALIQQFLNDNLDRRNFVLKREMLPALHLFNTQLTESSVILDRDIVQAGSLIHIEGRPGIGKSHLVSFLQKKFSCNLVYRFWISNQDREYNDRLKFHLFLRDISKKLFNNLKSFSEEEILQKIKADGRTVIIDGLDHVENYNAADLEAFIAFIDKLSTWAPTIVLSRPLVRKLGWKVQELTNWNLDQTRQVLSKLYHVHKAEDTYEIYRISDGYPILVKYIAEHYKINGCLPDWEKFSSLDAYYAKILEPQRSKQALVLFLTSHSFFMRSEIDMFLEDYGASFVNEFITEHPYLFELRLNRVSLFHDSMITFLRKHGLEYSKMRDRVNAGVVQSLLSGEKRFQSRVSFFELNAVDLGKIIGQYCNMQYFYLHFQGTVDFEAVQAFYGQLRELLTSLPPQTLDIYGYYDLSLILNIIPRDHVSTLHGFFFTYASALMQNGYGWEDVTSSGYLFGTLYYIDRKDASHILTCLNGRHHDTQNFYRSYQQEIEYERSFFEQHAQVLSYSRMRELLDDRSSFEFTRHVGYVLEDLFLHPDHRAGFPKLFEAISCYLDGNLYQATDALTSYFSAKPLADHQVKSIFSGTKANLLSLGLLHVEGDFHLGTLKDYFQENRLLGSFDIWPDIHSYLRLSLHRGEKIDIEAIWQYWTKYHQRKDYSLIRIDHALSIFEEKLCVDWKKSVALICYIQKVSEKGYRDLLANYLELHPPLFINNLNSEFEADDLIIDWFSLPVNYINVFSVDLFDMAMHKILREHRFHKKLNFSDFKNVLESIYCERFKKILPLTGFEIEVEPTEADQEMLKSKGLNYTVLAQEKKTYKQPTPHERFEQGVLTADNAFLIPELGLTPPQAAAYADGYYVSLSDLSIFQCFPKEELRGQILAILHAALTGRSGLTRSQNSPWLLPGMIPRLYLSIGIDVDFNRLFKSFDQFLDLSGIVLENE